MKSKNTKKVFALALSGVLIVTVVLTALWVRNSPPGGVVAPPQDPWDSELPGTPAELSELVPVINENGEPETVMIPDDQGIPRPYGVYVQKPADTTEPTAPPDPEAPSEEQPTYIVSPTDPESGEIIAAKKVIDALNSGNFHFVGDMSNSSEGPTKADLKIFESNFSLATELNGIEIEVKSINGKIFMVSPPKKIYMELSKVVAATMGISLSDFDFSDVTGKFKNTVDTKQTPQIYAATIEGEGTFTCYSYIKNSGEEKINLLFDGERLVRIDLVRLSDGKTKIMPVEKVEGGITMADIAIPTSYEKVNLIAFGVAIMGEDAA